MKAIYIKEVNKMREIPEMGYPNMKDYYGALHNFSQKLKEYNAQEAACKEYPCPPQHSFVEGVTYKEDVDYKLHHERQGGDLFTTAIPINKQEGEDEIWNAYDELHRNKYLDNPNISWEDFEELRKQSFYIQRKQK